MTPQVVPPAQLPLVWQQIQDDLQPRAVLSSLLAGLVTGVIGVIRAISYASLIFAGPLAGFLPTGLGLTVFSTGIVCAVAALTSTLPGLIATPLAAPTTILALMAVAIAQELQGGASDLSILSTVIVAITLASLCTGTLLLVLGVLKQGERIRVVPYPVIGGFMAGTGWLLVKGFVQVTADQPLTWASLPELWQWAPLIHWLPGVGFAILLLLLTQTFKQSWIMPVTLLGCVGLFYASLWLSHQSVTEAQAAGFLLGPFPEAASGLWQPLSVAILQQVQWGAIAHQAGSILTVILISLLSLLLSNSSIELVVGRDLNLSRELQAIGLSNLAAGLGGGMVGNQALPSTLLVHNMGAQHRLTGLFSTLPAIAVLALGSSFLSYLPKAVLGSLILYLGISLLWQWIYRAYFKLPLADYLAVWATLIVIDGFGFLQGIAVGFICTVILFMYRYSQVDVAKQVVSGAQIRSNVERDGVESRLLNRLGDQIYVLELQGFLFFGTANYLLNKVRDRAAANQTPITAPQAERSESGSASESGDASVGSPRLPLRYVLVDFRQVSGIDCSAVLTFSKILKLACQRDFVLVLTNLKPEFAAELQRGQGLALHGDAAQVFPDVDRGLEWCERQLLNAESSEPQANLDLAKQLTERFLLPQQTQRFVSYLELQSLPACYYIFRRGEAHKGLYFVAAGQVSVLLETGDGNSKRLQTCSSGSLLGEMRFFGKVPLSTCVVTDSPSQLYHLSPTQFERMRQLDPDLVEALQTYIVSLLCDSLIRREAQLRIIQ